MEIKISYSELQLFNFIIFSYDRELDDRYVLSNTPISADEYKMRFSLDRWFYLPEDREFIINFFDEIS